MFMLKARSRVADVPGVVWVLNRSLFFVAVMLALLVSAGVTYAQGTPTVPTIESVAVTSDPGEDGGYAIDDEIQVGLTFSEAVTVTGVPQLTLDVGGQNRTAAYSEGSATTQLVFSYTVATGDEDTDGIAVVADSLALNGGAIRAGATNATLTHAGLQANDHKVDGIAPTVTVGGETRTYVPPSRLFNVVFYFSEKVYGITDAEITVTNGAAHDVRAPYGNDTWPRYTRWDVVVLPAAEGPVTVTLQAGAATDAYGNGNNAPGSALSVIAADPVMVEVTRTTSGFAEGGKAEFIVTRSRDNGAIPVFLSVAQTGDLLSGAVEVYPPPDPNDPGEPVTPQKFTFTETPFNLNVTFAAGETSKRIVLPTEDDYKDEDNGTVTLSVPAKADQYKYIPGNRASATADVRDNDVAPEVSVFWVFPGHPFNPTVSLTTALEGGNIDLLVLGAARGRPLVVTLSVTEVGSYLDLDGEGAEGYQDLGNGKIQVTIPAEHLIQEVTIPLADNAVKQADGSVTFSVDADADRNYTLAERLHTRTIPVKDNDSTSTVTISGGSDVTEGAQLSYTLTRTWAPGQDQGQLIVNVQLAETGDYITWPTDHQPDVNDLVTIPVTIEKGSLTGTLTLDTVDDTVSENAGSVTATILADTNGKYVAATSSALTTALLDNDPPIISVEAVAAVVTEGTNAQYRITRSGNTSGSLRVGLYVTGLPKIMSTATETIVLTSDNEDQSKRLTINGAWVDYILEFAAGETEKTLPLTTEADSINEGDGWLAVSILQRTGVPYIIETGRAQVHVKDDDIPIVSLNRPVGPTGLTLSSDGTTWEGSIVEGTQFTYDSTCTGVTEFSDDARVNLDPVSMWVQYSNHPAFYGEQDQNGTLGYNRAGIHHLGTDCSIQTVTYRDHRFYVGPENGVLEIEIVPRSELVKQRGRSSRYRPRLFTELARQYEAAAAEAQAAGTLITKKNIFHPISLVGYHPEFTCNESDLRYCPQYQVGTVNKIRLTVTNRDPTILIKAESTSVTEGQSARFILERRWATDLLALAPPQSHTVVYLRASQDGQYITGALPTQITFGQNETRKVIELQTVDDSAFGDNGSVTIELLPDTSTVSENLHGKYTIWENWVGHTPVGGRSDRATVTITNNDDKSGITIAPAAATEGDSGSTDMTFTLNLAQAVTEAVTVNYVTSDGTATAGSDYTAVTNGTTTIPANSTSATFTVPVTGDTTEEANETFNVTISLPEPGPDLSDGGGSGPPQVAIVGGDTASAVGTIMDDDPVVVTVAAKEASVKEGQDAVFVLTRTGHTDDALSMRVRLSAPGKVETLSAEFDAAATTTELTVATADNDLVDYPPEHLYTIEVLGDGDTSGGDDDIYTPGNPSQATVTATDNDKLQIITVHPHEAFVREGGEAKFVFRRTGDTSEELRFTYMREIRQAETTEFQNYLPVSETFPAGLSEITSDTPVTGGAFPSDQVVNRLYPYKITAQVYGDGHRYGLHRIWKAGTPDTATIAYYDDDRTRDTVLLAKYPNLVQVGQTISIDFELLNTGSEATGNTITVSSVQLAVGDRNQTKPAEPRAGCSISGPLATGEKGTCRATFTLTAQDLTNSPMVLDATASDGTTTSSTQRIYITVLGGVAVGFNTTTRLSVTEPANGAANAQAVLAVTRVGESDEQVQVAYTVEPIRTQNRPYPAEEGADYVDNSATPGILTFAPNETEKNITIDILGDEIDEQREQFRVTLVPPEGVLVEAAKRNRAVAIVNRDPPSGESYLPTASLELVSADPIPESAGSVDFAVVLDRVWGEDARFEVELDAHDNLTATPAFSRLGQTGDFEAPDGLIHATIPAGQTRFEFSLTLYDDDVREEDETFQMLLGSSIISSQRQIGDEDEVLVTIADDDLVEPTGIELALTSNNGVFDSVAENSSQHNITVTASFSDIRWPTDAADAALRPADPRDVDTTVRVEFDSANSAAAQIDLERFQVMDSQGTFQDVESFDIVIPAGQTSGTATLRFKPVNDDVDEEAETVILQGAEVVASDSDEFLTVNSASFTITDDDTRGITISPASLATGSGIGMMEGETSTYSLVLDTEPTDTVTVTVASEQDNLIRLTPETLTFTPSNWSTTQTISVESLDDGADTSFRDAFISHQVSGGDYGSVSVGDIWVIIENTTQAYIYLEDAQASESDGYVEFTISVRPILRTVPVVVRYTTVDGTAAAGTDYTRQVNTGQTYKIFSIPANGGSGTIRIPITDNEVYGPAKKTFTLQLTNENNKALLDGDATLLTATGSIIDDDPKPVVSVAGPAGDLSYVSEDKKGPVTFTLTLTGRSAADVTVDYATGQAQVLSGLAARQGITPATAGEDYTAATGIVTFSPGDATKQVTVQLTDDDVSEDTEFFGFKISNAKNAQLRNDATEEVADVGLLDDDPRGVAIDPTSISLEEPAPGETAVASSYTVKLNSKPTDTVTVTVGGANPAVSLSGATLSNTNTLTFTTSNWDTAQTVTVTPVEDANGIGETITLTHIQSGGDYTGIAADSVTVNVTDSDTRNVVLSPTSLTVKERDDTGVSYTVKLSTQPSDTVTVTIGGHSGTELSISGTTLSNSNTLTFSTSNWNTAQTVTVKAGHDGNSDDESETLTHTASGGDYANLTKDLPVTVTDDAPATVTVSFGAASYTVAESDDSDTTNVTENTVEVTVTLSADPERTVVIPISKTNQGGATTADYTGVPQNVTFDSGDTSKSFTFTAAHDTVDDDSESVKLSFGATLPDGVSVGTTDEATVSITDDDVPSVTVSFGSAVYTVAESDDSDTTNVTENTVEVTVTLSADPERTVVIPIEKTNQNGATITDYTGVPQNVTFDSGETSKSFTFTAAHDTVDDDGESVKLSFGATLPDGVSVGTTDEATVSITDDDVPSVTVSFGSAVYTVAESDDSDTTNVTENTVEVTVTLSADPERTVVIPIEKTNQGGATTADYSGVPTSLTFSSGDTEKTFVFTAAHDTVDDYGESVKLSFGATLPTGVTAGTPATSTVTITDDDDPQVTVTFGAASYTVAEGSSRTVTVSLDADPERTVVIPIETANEGGASDSDYTGVPQSVTFEAGDTSKTFDISATEDNLAESGERVKLSFGTLPTDATAVTPSETTVSIHDRTQGQDLPTPPTVHFESAAYSVTEGASVSVKVILSKAPGSEAVIPISRANRAGATDPDYSGVPDTLTFGATDTEKTITFAATDDTVDDDGEKVELSFGTLPGGITATSGEGSEAVVTITDDDDATATATAKAIVLSPASITVTEEDATGTTYTVKLSHAPTSAVTVTISGHDGTALTISRTALSNDTLTFTSTNWDTAQTVTVKAAHDADPFGDTAFLLHRATGGGYDSASKTLPVTVTDNDTAAVVLDPASITVEEENATGTTYTVKLSHAPTSAVTVTIGGHSGTALSISGTTLNASDELTFTASNWDTAQTVTVKADNDDNAVSESLTLTHTPSGGGYSTQADLPVTVTDDDTAAIVLSETSLTVTEGDDAGVSYTVKLATQPTDTVTVTIGGHSGTALSISGTTLTSSRLTFTASTWNTAQTVTVKADDDGNADDESETLTHTASGADYANIGKDLPVTVEDDAPETVTVTFGAASYTVAEGSSRTVTVSLDADPERTVVIPIETANEGGASDSDYTGVPQSVTFEAGDTSKTFDISATEDNLAESGERVKLSFGTLPTDATAVTPSETTVSIHDRTQGQDLPTPPTVHFENATYSVDEGASTSIKVILSKAPGSEAVIPISRANRSGATDADYSVPDSLTFGATDTEKTITFVATDDTVDDDGEKVELSFGTLPGSITATSGEASEAVVTITDDDDATATAKAIVLSPASITVTEEDATGTTYTVNLASQPSGTVTVIVSGLSGTDLILSGTTLNADGEHTLSFTASNWYTAQTVTVTSNHDADPFDDTSSLLHRATGGGYDSASKTLPVTVTDNDSASIVLSPASITVEEENATGTTYTVKLSHAPTSAVTVTISGHDGTALTISRTALSNDTLTFTSTNWDTAQTVTVKADNDDNAVSESLTLTHTPSGGGYSTAADLPVTVTDDETAAIVLSESALTLTEGDDTGDSYTVKLAAQPSGAVTVTIGGHSGTALSVSGTALSATNTLTFTASNWDMAQTVKVKAGEDANAAAESETLTHTASGADYAGVTKNLPVTVEDDAPDTVTVSFGAASYTVAEGSSRTVTVSLDADPERTVVIPIETANQGGASDSDYTGVPQSVTFEAGDTSKSFTFTAAHDTVDDDGESVKLSFGASLPAGVSAGTPATSTVTITDDDVPSVTVSFGSAAYTVAESDDSDTTNVTENTVEVTVTLSADPERTVVIPIEKTNQNGATTADYTGVPQNVTFDSGETSKSFTFTAAHDTVDDDGESVKLSFGTMPDARVSPGATDELSLSITDDDDPQVTVAFGQSTYSAAEGSTVTVEVTLSADPERNVSIPIEKTNEGGAIAADYTGVPQSVTFDAGETLKSFVFTAETDTDDDHGESVRLSFDTMPDARVSKGSPSEAMVTIRQDSTQSTADCNSAIWCADLEFKSQSLPGEMWVLDDKPLDSEFDYNGVTYRFGGLSVDPYGHNIPINGRPNPPFAIPERTKFNLRLLNMSASGYSLDRFRMPNDDWMNWTLHVSTAKDGETLTAALPLSEGRFSEHYWIWHGSDLEALRLAWMEGQVYKLKIVEDPKSQRTPKVLGPPLYLKVTPYTNHTLGAWWKMPENRVDRAPPNTTYKVQWKEASDSWDNPADVSEETDSPSPATKETLFHSIRGLTGGVEYHVRVIATNTVGDSEPSEVVSGTPTPLQAAGQNIAANSPAKRAPSIEGTPEVGQTLSAVTTDITDDDGLQDVVFSYQWLADDVEISGADGATYILTSDDLGKAINVRVDFTDNAGNEESLTSAPTAAVTAAEDLELQSATVDGSTLTLTYNETLDTSVTLPASAFVVNVNEASRSIMGAGVGGSSVLLLLSSAVETGDTVTVDYTAPDGQDFIRDSQGRKAESFSGQEVTNNTASSGTPRTIPPPAPGSPNSLKVARHESGKLLASWSAPNSGPAPTAYTLQWKESGDDWDDADDVSEANVKGTSHVITGLTDGVQYAVRVIAYKGDAESDPSGEVTATPQETVAPSPSAASVDGATLTVTFDEALAEVQAPASTAFAVTVAGNSRGVSAVAVSGSAVTLTLVTAVLAGEAVTVDYTVPTGESAVGLQDVSGNAAASFSGQQVTNDTQAAAQLTASVSVVPESHDGGTVFTFELRFSETPRKRFSYKIMRDLAFTVTGGEVTGARRLAPRSNVGWEIHVRPDGNGPVTIVLPVTTDCTAEGAICTEDRRPLSNRLEITVPAPGG